MVTPVGVYGLVRVITYGLTRLIRGHASPWNEVYMTQFAAKLQYRFIDRTLFVVISHAVNSARNLGWYKRDFKDL